MVGPITVDDQKRVQFPSKPPTEEKVMKVLICGGRFFSDKDLFNLHMADFYKKNNISEIIQGGARGADYLAKRWGEIANIPIKEFLPDWETHGKKAGILRNQQMLDEGKPEIVLAFPGGSGTADMVRRAKKAGITVVEFMDEQPRS